MQLDQFPGPVHHTALQRVAPTRWKGRCGFRMGRPGARGEAERVVTARAVKEVTEQPSLGESDRSFSAGLPSVSLPASLFCYDRLF